MGVGVARFNRTKRQAQDLFESEDGKEVGAKVQLQGKQIVCTVHALQKGRKPQEWEI